MTGQVREARGSRIGAGPGLARATCVKCTSFDAYEQENQRYIRDIVALRREEPSQPNIFSIRGQGSADRGQSWR